MKVLARKFAVAAFALAALAASTNRADAAIRLTLISGATTQTYFSAAGAQSLANSATIDGYTVALNTVVSNFNTQATDGFGSLVTTTSYSTGAGPIGDLTVIAEVITDAGIGNTTVGSNLANFTIPSTANALATVNVTGAGTSGTVLGTTIAGAVSVPIGPFAIPGLVENAASASVNTTGGYTLSNRTVIAGVAANSTSQSVTVRSTVAAVPEPATVAMILSAVPVVGFGLLRRRKAD